MSSLHGYSNNRWDCTLLLLLAQHLLKILSTVKQWTIAKFTQFSASTLLAELQALCTFKGIKLCHFYTRWIKPFHYIEYQHSPIAVINALLVDSPFYHSEKWEPESALGKNLWLWAKLSHRPCKNIIF